MIMRQLGVQYVQVLWPSSFVAADFVARCMLCVWLAGIMPVLQCFCRYWVVMSHASKGSGDADDTC